MLPHAGKRQLTRGGAVCYRDESIPTIMKTSPLFIIAALLVSPLLPGASLGDSIEASREREAAEARRPILSKATVNGVEYRVHSATLTSKLVLPDAMSHGKCITPRNEGSVVLFIQGEIVNTSSEAKDLETPKFMSAAGNVYDPEKLYVKSKKSEMFEKLNPMEKSDLVLCFIVPVTELIGGKLQCKDGEMFSESACAFVPLPFNNSTHIHDSLVVNGVTDNMFDTAD